MSAAVATLPPPPQRSGCLKYDSCRNSVRSGLRGRGLSSVTPRGDGHPVLVLPDLRADDNSTSALRSFLTAHGYNAYGWKQGRNFGLRPNLERDMLARID